VVVSKGAVEEAEEQENVVVSEKELMGVLGRVVEEITNGKSISRRDEVGLLRMLRRCPNIMEAAVEMRMLVAQYCTGMFSMRMINPENQNLTMNALEDLRGHLTKTYLISAWEILSRAPSEGLEGQNRSKWFSLKLDVACRLHDTKKMLDAYEEAKREVTDQHQDRLVLLASAALVGRWDEVRKLGTELAPSGELDILHAASLKDPSLVDYSSLFLLSAHVAGPDGDDSVFKGMDYHLWKAFEMKSARFRLPLGSNAVPLRPDLVPGSWISQRPFAGVPLLRTGAVAHMVNPGPVPLPLSGFAGKDEMCMLGYFDVEQGGEQVRFTEFFTLKRDQHREDYWVGKELSTMVAVAGPKAGENLVEAMIDVEFEFVEDTSSIWKAV